MGNELQHRSSSAAVSLIFSRRAMTALAIGALFFSAAYTAKSQGLEAAQPPTYGVLYTFTGETADGLLPFAFGGDPILDPEGNLYGTTPYGGDLTCHGCGVVFKVDRTGKETVFYTFTGGVDGSQPAAGVIRDEASNLYGTTYFGGTYGAGVVFKLDRSGKETVLYTFTGGADGSGPAGLIRDEAGNLYGTTYTGGTYGAGVVFKLDCFGKETVLYTFTGGADGNNPFAAVARDIEGNLYSTTNGGGSSGLGVVFKLDRAGKESVLHSFAGPPTDGAGPEAAVILDEAGNIYGTTTAGGSNGAGAVFKLDRAGEETILHAFTGGADGGSPTADLVRDQEGNLYGTTYYGGNSDCFSSGTVPCGVVFKVDRTGKETVLHSFIRSDGSNPNSGLVRDAEGNLYGATVYGGDLSVFLSGAGVVFKLTP